MDEIIQIITQYGVDSVLLALVINLATSLIKRPIKIAAHKSKNVKKITRFIVFIPIVVGLIINLGYSYVFSFAAKPYQVEFYNLWLSSTSLSLAFYALLEKFFSEKNVSQNYAKLSEENFSSQNIINLIDTALKQHGLLTDTSKENNFQSQNKPKIIIRENKDDEINKE